MKTSSRRLTVGGLLSGTFYLFGVPRFEANSDGSPGGILRLDAAGFTFKTNSPLTRVGVSGCSGPGSSAPLQGAAWWDVSPELQAAAAQFGGVLNRDLSSQARLSGRLTRFGPRRGTRRSRRSRSLVSARRQGRSGGNAIQLTVSCLGTARPSVST